MTTQEIKDIYTFISHGNHGSFLTHFAQAFIHADSDNTQLLRPTAISLIRKYKLDKETAIKWKKYWYRQIKNKEQTLSIGAVNKEKADQILSSMVRSSDEWELYFTETT